MALGIRGEGNMGTVSESYLEVGLNTITYMHHNVAIFNRHIEVTTKVTRVAFTDNFWSLPFPYGIFNCHGKGIVKLELSWNTVDSIKYLLSLFIDIILEVDTDLL
jgi:hypothetical protein